MNSYSVGWRDYMNKVQALELLFAKIEEIHHISSALSIIQWDASTTGVPEKSLATRGESVGWLSGRIFNRMVASDTMEAIETLEACGSELTDYEAAMTRNLGRTCRKMQAVPSDEFEEFSSLTAQAQMVWETARAKDDFNLILPYYEKIFAYQRRLCDWYGYMDNPYNALLDDYERDASVEILDDFFSVLSDRILPLVKEITLNGRNPREIVGVFDIEKQKELLPWLTDFVGFDRTRGKTGEVEHPFTISVDNNDVRISTKYHSDSILSSIYSIIHESGHGIYEQNFLRALRRYDLADGASMGIHESQSRLYENIFCRSRAFSGLLLHKLQGLYDYFNDWNEDSFYRALNISRPSLIRIEADELTYCLHIMIRYELEKALINGDIKVADLPEIWNDRYAEVIGIRPSNDAKGVLQDIHWSGGLVGYFPTYAIGTAYGAQIVHAMEKTINTDECIRSGSLSEATAWLNENIHQYGSLLLPGDLLKKATGESFNPKYYTDYLHNKFSELYLK